MKKTIMRSLLTLLLLCTVMLPSFSVQAVPVETSMIDPRLTGIANMGAVINISDKGWATCAGNVTPKTGYSVDLKVELQQDGSTIKSWTGSGSRFFEVHNRYLVSSGHDYEVKVTATISDSRDHVVATEVLYSGVWTY